MPILTDISAAENAHRTDFRDGAGDMIEIGLLNNMPDQALQATERQFKDLIEAAAGPRPVRLRRFFLPDLPRGEVAHAYLRTHYADASALRRTRLDALIVTGQEPRAPRLSDEPYWRNLTGIVDWAQDNTITTIWSCLAAHAAVLHLDGVERHRLANKLCGIFDCDKVEDNRLLANIAEPVSIPHSRYNDLRESELVRKGYRILTRSAQAGADMFFRKGRSLFVFFQGHPEYDAHSLLGEYRRDIGRFLHGEMEAYPILPQGYFSAESSRLLANFAARASVDRHPDMLAEFPEKNVLGDLIDRWQETAVQIFRNWLDYIISQKTQSLRRAASTAGA